MYFGGGFQQMGNMMGMNPMMGGMGGLPGMGMPGMDNKMGMPPNFGMNPMLGNMGGGFNKGGKGGFPGKPPMNMGGMK